jgi:hypothetical protein
LIRSAHLLLQRCPAAQGEGRRVECLVCPSNT